MERMMHKLRGEFLYVGSEKISGNTALKIIETVFEEWKNDIENSKTQLQQADVSGLCCPKGCGKLCYTHDDMNNRSCCECGETWAI